MTFTQQQMIDSNILATIAVASLRLNAAAADGGGDHASVTAPDDEIPVTSEKAKNAPKKTLYHRLGKDVLWLSNDRSWVRACTRKDANKRGPLPRGVDVDGGSEVS